MKHRKLNKYEKRIENKKLLERTLHGEGLYIYQNNTKGDLVLPKPTASGVRTVGIGKQFQGDNYYMKLVKSNDLKYIKEIISPEGINMEQKLMLDQPDRFTHEGKTEQIVFNPQKILNENKPEEKQPDFLINEDPMANIEIIIN